VFAAAAAELPNDTPLVAGPDATLRAIDFEAAMARIPERLRPTIRMSQEKISTMVDGLFIAKSIAQKARNAGLDKDPIVQQRLQQAQDQVLADLFLQKAEKEAKFPALEQRAREVYNSDTKRFQVAEQVYVQQILVNYAQRTPEMALARANEVVAEARKPGQNFLAYAREVTEDAAKRRNGGDLGWNAPTSFEPEIVEWLKTAKDKDTISDPIKTRHGYHIIKFVDRKPARQRPFEEVKQSLMDDDRANLVKAVRDDAINAVRHDPKVVIHAANVEALRVEVDPELLTRMQQATPPGTAPMPAPGRPGSMPKLP
jgi:peptidyl-prolyl cis-trans isomerase C